MPEHDIPEQDPTDPAAAPQISVIVRSMNRPSLATALDSVALQDVPGVQGLEVLVVDATGGSHAPLPSHAGAHPLRLVQAGRPLPRSQAANAGLDAAAGRQVIFLDDDDVFLPGHLARLAAALQARPDAVAAYADVDHGHHGPDGWQTRHRFAADFDPLRLRFENFIPLHAALVSRSRPEARRCRFDETLDLFEDWDWWLQLARQGAFVRVPGVSARYVAADDGGSGVFADSAAGAQARAQLLHKWLALDGPDDRLRLLQALQQHYRAAHQTSDELQLARRTEHDLRDIIAARDHDLADAAAQHADLLQVLAAREHEITEQARQMADLRLVLAAREHDIAEGLAHSQDLQHIVAARDDEIAHLTAQLAASDPTRTDLMTPLADPAATDPARTTVFTSSACFIAFSASGDTSPSALAICWDIDIAV